MSPPARPYWPSRRIAPNHDGVLFEFRRLARLLPSGGAAHVRNTDAVVF